MTNSFAKTHYFFLLIELKKNRNGIFNTQSIPFGVFQRQKSKVTVTPE